MAFDTHYRNHPLEDVAVFLTSFTASLLQDGTNKVATPPTWLMTLHEHPEFYTPSLPSVCFGT